MLVAGVVDDDIEDQAHAPRLRAREQRVAIRNSAELRQVCCSASNFGFDSLSVQISQEAVRVPCDLNALVQETVSSEQERVERWVEPAGDDR